MKRFYLDVKTNFYRFQMNLSLLPSAGSLNQGMSNSIDFSLMGRYFFAFHKWFPWLHSVSDHLHFDVDPDPRIYFRENWTNSIFFSFFFFCKRYKTPNDRYNFGWFLCENFTVFFCHPDDTDPKHRNTLLFDKGYSKAEFQN